MVVTFLDNQPGALTLSRTIHHAKPLVIAGVGEDLQLFSEDLELLDSKSVAGSKVIRLSSVSNTASCFFATERGVLGFVALGSSELGSVDSFPATSKPNDEKCLDADLHRSGHLASQLFHKSLALIDVQREALVGSVPLGLTGSPSAVRVVDTSLMAVSSSIVSLFDVRTSDCKSGIASSVLEGGTKGRIFTALESDAANLIVAGDSSGGLFMWDSRKPCLVLKHMHAHSGAVSTLSIGAGFVCSGGADGSVSTWRVSEEIPSSRKKSRKFLDSADSGDLRRVNVSGTPTAVAIDTSHLVYATDTGVLTIESNTTRS